MEDRTLPSGDGFAAISAYLGQAGNALSGVQTALNTLVNGATAKLPILGTALKDLPEARGIQGPSDLLGDLKSQMQSILANVPDADAARQQLSDALGENGLGILGDTDGNNGINANDIVIVPDSVGGDNFALSIRLTKSFTVAGYSFNVGLPSIPLFPDVAANGNIILTVTLDYDQFTLHVQDGVVHFETADPVYGSPSKFRIQVTAHIPGAELTGRLGFLTLSAVDTPERVTHKLTELTGTFTMDVSPTKFLTNMRFTGSATVSLAMTASFGGGIRAGHEGPSFSSNFYLNWKFSDEKDLTKVSPDFGEGVDVEFRDISLHFGSFLADMFGPSIEFIQFLTEPVAPLFGTLAKPLPILSQLADYFPADLLDADGDGDVSVLDLGHRALDLGLIPPPYDQIVRVFIPLVEFTNLIDKIDFYDTDAVFTFGDCPISGDGGVDLRDLSLALDPDKFDDDPMAPNWSFVSAGTIVGLNLDEEKKAIQNAFNGLADVAGDPGDPTHDAVTGIGAEIVQRIDDAQKIAYNGYHVDFPFFQHPEILANLMLARDVDLFSFAAQAFVPHTEIPVKSIPIGPAHMDLDVTFMHDGFFRVGYDTFGLRQLGALWATNPAEAILHLGDGFFLDAATKFELHAGVALTFSAGFEIIEPYVQGELSAGITATVDGQPGADLDGDPSKLRFTNMDPPGEFGDCVLQTDGGISGSITFGVKIGVDTPLGFVGVDFNHTLAGGQFISFDSGCIDPWPHDIVLAGQKDIGANGLGVSQDPDHTNAFHLQPAINPGGVLILNMGPNASDRNFKVTETTEYFSVIPADPKPGDLPGMAVIVSAFGINQRYDGVKKILAYGGDGNDSIDIAEGVDVDVELYGDQKNDPSVVGDDQLKYAGAAIAFLDGGPGADVLTGGSGVNALHGRAGDDTVIGGTGDNSIYGEGGNDYLYAGPKGDYMEGGSGDDKFVAGMGDDQMWGGDDNDTFTWVAGNGSTTIDAGSGFNLLGMAGSDEDETYVASKLAAPDNRVKVAAPNGKKVISRGLTKLGIDGLGGHDEITIQPLSGTRIVEVGVNLSDKVLPDEVPDTIVVNGRPDPDDITVETVEVIVQKYQTKPQEGEGGIWVIKNGGVMKVGGLPFYSVYAMNFADDLTVNGNGQADTMTVKSITGPTHVNGNGGNDAMRVFADGVNEYLTPLDVDAGAGTNSLLVDEAASPAGDHFVLSSQKVTSGLLPAVNYTASGGNYAGGIGLNATTKADDVNIKSTRAGATTTVSTLGGPDTVRVGSAAPGKVGHLGGIAGAMAFELGSGANILQLSDWTAVAGNQNVIVTATQVQNFAGPGDITSVSYKATGGTIDLTLEGSDTLSEKFLLNNPGAAVRINANGGNDIVNVLALTQPAKIEGGLGDEIVTVGLPANKLDLVLAPLTVTGGGGKDVVMIADQNTGPNKTYSLSAGTFSRLGVPINFDPSLESLNVATSNFNDLINVTGIPTVTKVSLKAGGGVNDQVTGPNGSNLWQIATANGGSLNARVAFADVEYVVGGADKDNFVFAKTGSLSGTVAGQNGHDSFDYSAWTTPVVVNLQTAKAPAVAGFGGIERFVGGQAADQLFGKNADATWHILGSNTGQVVSANSSVDFVAIEHLFGGGNADKFVFHPVGPGPQIGQMTGNINGQGGVNYLDYSPVSIPVVVNLPAGQVTGVLGAVSGIVNVTGGQSDDILVGNQVTNVLKGEGGSDLLIGGGAMDVLDGGLGDDILIGGGAQFAGSLPDLKSVLLEWTSGTPYDRRVQHLLNGGSSFTNIVLSPASMIDDLAGDIMTGALGDDLFWANLSMDTITDLVQPPERVGSW